MNECIFGIKCNGVSIGVSQITIDDDQSNYDYICNVSLKDSWNGNGTYDVSIINKDYIKGMPVGNWRLKNAWIIFNWGDSRAKLIMEDEDGNETCEITADTQKGSASGFDLPSLARTIFTKAQEIVRDYSNAKICNAMTEWGRSKKSLDRSISYSIDRYKNNNTKSNEEYIDIIDMLSRNISTHLGVFKKTKKLLEEYDDERNTILLKDITSDCLHLINRLKDFNN